MHSSSRGFLSGCRALMAGYSTKSVAATKPAAASTTKPAAASKTTPGGFASTTKPGRAASKSKTGGSNNKWDPNESRVMAELRAAYAEYQQRKSTCSGLKQVVRVSDYMQYFLGLPEQECSRVVAVKKVWEYIKANKLQEPNDKRRINCDDKLALLLDGEDTVTFSEIPKLLEHNFWKPPTLAAAFRLHVFRRGMGLQG